MADDRRETEESQPTATGERPGEPAPTEPPSGESGGQGEPGGAGASPADESGPPTEAFEPGDLTRPTEAIEPGDLTPPIEPAEPAGSGTQPTPPRWSARAHVPPAGQDEVIVEPEEWAEPSRAPRGIAVPVLIVICVLLLLALVALGTWLALRERPSSQVPPPTGTTTTTPPTTEPPTTTAAPTDTMTPPPTTGPIVVTLPDLHGSDYDTAAAALSGLGLVPVRVDQTSTSVAAGQVIGTDPAAGTAAAPGLRVDVFVSTGPPAPTTTTTTEAPPTGEPS